VTCGSSRAARRHHLLLGPDGPGRPRWRTHRPGLDVPGELGVVGLGDIPQAGWTAYQLTTVHLPIDEMIDLAVKDLLARVADPDRPPRPMVANARIVGRASTR
jgi:DNA-binding LacI/PurR family transcriptional regulator